MNRKKLNKVKRLLDQARLGQRKAKDLEQLAKMVGRKKDNRGKHPTWVHDDLPVYPLSIPHHSGRDLPLGTKNSILDILDEDVVAWDQKLEREAQEAIKIAQQRRGSGDGNGPD
jgi:predicted RNA binding protein YcfA (HicA-like mRNA interferase family)